jgi:NADH-quinone oxidoreductase subunit L
MITTAAFLLPLPPLTAFALILLFTRRSRALSTGIALGGIGLSAAGALVIIGGALMAGDLAANPPAASLPWIPLGAEAIRIGVHIDGLTVLTLTFVVSTLLAIFVYSVGYHNFGSPAGDADIPGLPPRGAPAGHGHAGRVPSVEPLYTRFFAFISLFAAGMLLLVLADNLITLFVGWEVMGLCSYLLIGFWYGRERARRAAVKAFLVTRVGDVLMLLGLSLLYRSAGTLNLAEIFSDGNLGRMAADPAGVLGLSAAGLAALLLFAGTIGKSAQWPLHIWLPDAMEGPTPVSALIHAATMVSAGIYLLLRMAPLLSAAGAPVTQAVAFIGAFTALFASLVALTQHDIKRVLAWSTIAQLGYMAAAAGIGAYAAAGFHLAMHAFFKALLFLGAGSVIHGVEHGALHTGAETDAQDMRNMGGLSRRMPFTFVVFLAGGLSLAGFPLLTAGFWSKDGILAAAYAGSPAVFAVLGIAALLTAFYTARQITLVFLGGPRSEAAAAAAEPSRWMRVPLGFLALCAVGAGWLGIPKEFPVLGGILPDWIGDLLARPALARTAEEIQRLMELRQPICCTLILPEPADFRLEPLLVSLAVSLGGLLLGWLVYRKFRAGQTDPLQRALGPVHAFLQDGCRFDALYDRILVRPLRAFSDTVVADWMDRRVLDGILHGAGQAAGALGKFLRGRFDLPVINGAADRAAAGTQRTGRELRALQTGRVQDYLLFGLLIFLACGAVVMARWIF